jgi:hypothetical protein
MTGGMRRGKLYVFIYGVHMFSKCLQFFLLFIVFIFYNLHQQIDMVYKLALYIDIPDLSPIGSGMLWFSSVILGRMVL